MRLDGLNLQNFRNIAGASLTFAGASHFLLGPNGQGKTNLLEAIGLVTALRSFRTQETRPLLREGTREAGVLYRLSHEQRGGTEVRLDLRAGSKTLHVDGERVRRLGDHLGAFPTVVLSSDDIQLLRGSPGLRRRFLDLTAAAVEPAYFAALRDYHRALKERNSLLRSPGFAPALAEPYEKILARAAAVLVGRREAVCAELAEDLRSAYAELAQAEEAPGLGYRPKSAGADAAAFREVFAAQRGRDREAGMTRHGPHRDDVALLMQGRDAQAYASEGQQRGLVVALRLAQLRWFQRGSGLAPVVLADDVLGELDPRRREGFWRVIGPELQVIATGTVPPPRTPGRAWRILKVHGGTFNEVGGG